MNDRLINKLEELAQAKIEVERLQAESYKILNEEFDKFNKLMNDETTKAIFTGKDRVVEYMGKKILVKKDFSGLEIISFNKE